MRLWRPILPAVACILCAAAPAADTIGSWVLRCPADPGTDGCTLRHKDASIRIGTVGAALEVQPVGGGLVPVVAVRGLSPQAAIAASLAARVSIGLRLDKGPWITLPCAGLALCAPAPDAVPALVRDFPAARSVSLRIEVKRTGGPALPRPEHTFRLTGTKQALDRLKAAGVATTSEPSQPGLDWMDAVKKLLRAGGG